MADGTPRAMAPPAAPEAAALVVAPAAPEAAAVATPAVVPTKKAAWTPRVIESLRTRYGAKADDLFDLLEETGSVISGGAVLSACTGEVITGQDHDFYVPAKQIPRFLNTMVKGDDPIFKAKWASKYGASFYCTSFLRKNGIRRVYTFKDTADRWDSKGNSLDIMSVRNARDPLSVVTNFDLTFCQVWFDGRDVYATHPEHIKTKTGELQYDYCMTLLSGNRFLKKRIKKYLERGFTVTFDPKFDSGDAFSKAIELIGRGHNRNECTAEDEDKYHDPVYTQKWYNRIAMRYFLGIRDSGNGAVPHLLHIPLNESKYHNQTVRGAEDVGSPYAIARFEISKDDGYDSDDINEEELKRIAVENYVVAADEGAVTPEMKAARAGTNLVLNARDSENSWRSLGSLLKGWEELALRRRSARRIVVKFRLLMKIIEERALRSGGDLFGDEGPLYDIHYHDEMGGVTQSSLETYLRDTMTGTEYDVKCYYAGAGCTKKLTLSEIGSLVTPAFYAEYSAPRPVKSGLDLEVDSFDSVFRNIKTPDSAWGMIYHATMCPFCLKFEERGHGCSVMTHENPEGKGPSAAPYCPTGRAIPEMIQKYTTAARALTDGYARLEFCVECGRPSSGHQHFNFDLTELIAPLKKPDPHHPGQMTDDYGACPGGGRPEMIARMMAVRDVYRRRNIRNVVEERRAAAAAAEAAPLNPALMARANALWDAAQPGLQWYQREKEAMDAAEVAGQTKTEIREARAAARRAFAAANPRPADIKWDIPAPKTKKYNDPLYSDSVNDAEYARWLDGPDADPPGPGAAPGAPAPAAPAAPAASLLQRDWNQRTISGLENGLERNHMADSSREKIEILISIARAELAGLPEGQPAYIDLNLVNATATYALAVAGAERGLATAILVNAVALGGATVYNGIDPDIGPENVDALAQLKRDVAAAAAPAPAAAPAQGGRKNQSFRRRRGRTLRKTRYTRRA